MTLAAINFYWGTQRESIDSYRKLLRRAARVAANLQARLGVSLEEINLGGGIPSQSLRRIGLHTLALRLKDDAVPSDSPGALEKFAYALSAEFHEGVRSAGLRPLPAMAVEPGRSIVGDAAILLTRVRAVQGKWAFLDASHNYLGESPFLFARRVLPVTDPGPGTRRYYHLSGSSLNSRDIIDVRRRLPVLVEGDLLALCDAGAYSISRAARYASLSPALYLVLADGSLRLIRRAEKLLDLTCPMVMPGDGGRPLGE
jgi:diaminopimelate decarboxylase